MNGWLTPVIHLQTSTIHEISISYIWQAPGNLKYPVRNRQEKKLPET